MRRDKKAWIGILALEEWAHETFDPPSGPMGRRLRWHQTFSNFDLTVGYIPGKENMIADILSRWAYPASKAWRDISKHGSEEDLKAVKEIIEEEEMEETELGLRDQKLGVGEQHPTAKVLREDGLTVGVSPVGAQAEVSAAPPLRFTFKTPPIQRNTGKHVRPEDVPSRKSPRIGR